MEWLNYHHLLYFWAVAKHGSIVAASKELLHNKTYANLENREEVFTVGINRAVTLIAEKIAKGPRKGRFGADPGRPLGDHPDKGGPITVKNGRYGPYVSHAGVNATLPKDVTPEQVTLAQAIELLNARSAKSGDAPRARRTAPRRAKPATTPAPAAKKPKPAAKPVAKKKKAAK